MVMSKKIGKYTYELSTKKGKKLMTKVNDKVVHFGDITMEHFKDKTNLLPKRLNHNDKDRRKNYLTRSAGIKDKSGKLTKDNPMSPNYHSRRILWSA
tara:strand:- start:703 stop:993 length:291 start_codon:yes stop_codon:yes gene_type:complete